jgi:hypothetical protein
MPLFDPANLNLKTTTKRLIMDKLDIFKKATRTVVGLGITRVVSAVVKNNVPDGNFYNKVAIHVGIYVIGGMISEISKGFTDEKIDEVVTFYDNHVRPRISK